MQQFGGVSGSDMMQLLQAKDMQPNIKCFVFLLKTTSPKD